MRLVPLADGLQELVVSDAAAPLGRLNCALSAEGQAQVSRRQVEVQLVDGHVRVTNLGQGPVRLVRDSERLSRPDGRFLLQGAARTMADGDTLQLCAFRASDGPEIVVASWQVMGAASVASLTEPTLRAPSPVEAAVRVPQADRPSGGPNGSAHPEAPGPDPAGGAPRRETFETRRIAPSVAGSSVDPGAGAVASPGALRAQLQRELTSALDAATAEVLQRWLCVPLSGHHDATGCVRPVAAASVGAAQAAAARPSCQATQHALGAGASQAGQSLETLLFEARQALGQLRAVLQPALAGVDRSCVDRSSSSAEAHLSAAERCILEAVKEVAGSWYAQGPSWPGEALVGAAAPTRQGDAEAGPGAADTAVRASGTGPPGANGAAAALGGDTGDAAARPAGGTTSPRRYTLRERRARPEPTGDSLALGFRCGVARSVPRQEGGWEGGRLFISEVFGPDSRALEPAASACVNPDEADALTSAAEALYRGRLPGLNVIQETQGGSRYDFVVDSLMHSAGAVTAVLQVGVSERSAYVDGGEDESVAGAITLRVRRAGHVRWSRGGVASGESEGQSLCMDCGEPGCDGSCGGAAGGPDYGEVLACAVSKRHARCGIGRLLVAWAKLNAHAEGLRFLLVSASTDVVGFWEGLGFGEAPAHCAAACGELHRDFDGSVVLYMELPADAQGGEVEEELAGAVAGLRARSSRAAGHKRPRQAARA